MVKLINSVTKSEMWVHESRLDDYLAAGHKLAPLPSAPKKEIAPKRKTKAKQGE